MRKKYIDVIIGRCDELVEAFANYTEANGYKLNISEKEAIWTVSYSLVNIEFVFKKDYTDEYPICTFYSRIYLDRNSNVYYHLPELMEYLDDGDFKCYYFSYVESKERMEVCFTELFNCLIRHKDKFPILAKEERLQEKLIKSRKDVVTRYVESLSEDEMKALESNLMDTYNGSIEDEVNDNEDNINANIEDSISSEDIKDNIENDNESDLDEKEEIDDEDFEEKELLAKQKAKEDKRKELIENNLVKIYDEYIILARFTGETGYKEFIDGEYEKAKYYYNALYNRELCTSYEKRLLEFIKVLIEKVNKDKEYRYEVIPEKCQGIKTYEKYIEEVENKGDFFSALFILEMLLGSIIAVVILWIKIFQETDTLVHIGVPFYMGYLIGAIPAIYGALIYQHYVANVFFREEYNMVHNYDRLLEMFQSKVKGKLIFTLIMMLCVYIAISISFTDTRLYKDKIIYNEAERFFDYDYTSYKYEDIDKVYFTEGYYDDYNEYIVSPSYVILFKDGESWDSDDFTTVEVVENQILPILEDLDIKVHEIKDRSSLID